VHGLPEKITFGQGAGVWVPYGTAYHALYHSAEARASERCWYMAQAAESAARRSKWRTPWASRFWHSGHAERPRTRQARRRASVFDHGKAGYQEEIMKATGGRGVDVFLKCSAM